MVPSIKVMEIQILIYTKFKISTIATSALLIQPYLFYLNRILIFWSQWSTRRPCFRKYFESERKRCREREKTSLLTRDSANKGNEEERRYSTRPVFAEIFATFGPALCYFYFDGHYWLFLSTRSLLYDYIVIILLYFKKL